MAAAESTAPSYKTTLAPVLPLLADLGFKKRAGVFIFTREIRSQVFGWLGLNVATQHRHEREVSVNPVVGNHFEEVESIYEACRSVPRSKHVAATISRPIGIVMDSHGFKCWEFTPENATAMATDMASVIATYGIPFMESGADLGELRRRIDLGYGLFRDDYLRPIAAILDGDREQARLSLDKSIDGLGRRADDAGADFRKFADNFRARYLS